MAACAGAVVYGEVFVVLFQSVGDVEEDILGAYTGYVFFEV